jgi:tetratricopeptide (TPR) repeat protein
MKAVPREVVRVLTLAVLTIGTPTPSRAQDPCPSASAMMAEEGWTAYQAGDMVAARRSFQAALARCENDQYARTGLGYVALRDGDTAEATRLMTMVVRSEPNNVDALVGLGLASWRTGDLEAVESNFDRVLQLAPDHPTALEYMERVTGARRAEAGDPANEAWVAGDTEAALRLYLARLDADPSDDLALLRAGLIRAWNGQYGGAIELLGLLLDQYPNNLDGLLARARVRAWSGDVPGALKEVTQILAVQPDNVDALAALALFQFWSGQVDESLANYDQLLSIAPEHGDGRRQQAQALVWVAQYDQSLTAFEALVRDNPNDIDARLGLANALAVSGRFDDAVANFDRIIAVVPDEMRALTGKAQTLGWAGRLVESEAAAVRAVEVDPASAAAWASLGKAYRAESRPAAALEAFTTASSLAPTDAEIRDQLRAVQFAFRPVARPTFMSEGDSDENRMLTASIASSWHPAPKLDVRASAYRKSLEQTFPTGRLERSATGLSVIGSYELGAGWAASAGLGASVTDGVNDPRFGTFSLGGRSPLRFPIGVGVNVSSSGLDETAALAERGVRATEVVVTGRWNPGPLWRVDGNVGLGRYNGTEPNGRRSGFLGGSRRVGRFFSLGAAVRGFTFEKNLNDGYFDPDFYGVAELTSYWLYRPAPWTFLIEVAPGVQQVTRAGDAGGSLRSNMRVAYRVAAGREVSLSFGYSSAGLTSFATGDAGYSYTAFILGANWVF